jgi:Fe-S cluster assembly ATP-binding protein
MGPNGSGKSTLAYALMGHPAYGVTDGSVLFNGHDLLALSPDKRAHAGVFLAFQHPYTIPGVTVFALLREAYQAVTGTVVDIATFKNMVHDALARVDFDGAVADRAVNEGFSGGEKKRLEVVQMLILKPSLVILDEIDSGLDVDALRVVASALLHLKQENPSMSIVCITHYPRILDYLVPDFVHIIDQGQIINSGDAHLARVIEQSGYGGLRAHE